MVAHDPKLSAGHKQQKVVHRQGHFDPRSTIDPGPMPPANPFAVPYKPPPPEPMPHPVESGYGLKTPKPANAAQEKRDRHQREARYNIGSDRGHKSRY